MMGHRLWTLYLTCLLLIGAALNNEADRYLQQRLVNWADSSEAGRLRMQISSNDVIDAMVQWSSTGERIFPPPDSLPHVSEDAMLADLKRLEALRSATASNAWERVAAGSDTYYRCFRDRCLQVDGAALGRALGWASGEHTVLVDQSRSTQAWAVAVGFFGALLCFVALWSLRKGLGTAPALATEEDAFPFGPVTVNASRLAITDHEGTRAITQRELKLLRLFAGNPEAVLGKDQLYDAGWGRDYQPSSRALDQQVLTLRRKLDPQRRHRELIETVHGQGYRYRG